jgi:hypothetical protein
MKRMLYVLQQSILDNDRNWLSADSNINMASGFFRAWIDHNDMEGYEVEVMITPIVSFGDIVDFTDVFPAHPRLNFIQTQMTRNAALNRMDFRSWQWSQIIQNRHYDVIVTCVPEWVLGIKTTYDMLKMAPPKIVAQCFWLDTPMIGEPKQPEAITLQYRQAEGFVLADLVVFTCQSTRNAWIQNAIKLLAPKPITEIMAKMTVWDFGYSQSEVEEMVGGGSMRRKTDVARIGFPNRMGSDGYTNASAFIAALRILKDDPQYADSFEVVFTNPSKRVSEDWLKENVPNFVSFMDGKTLTRKEYFQFLYECDITVHLFVKERYGGCALRESIAAGNYTVVADCHEQQSLVMDASLRVSVDPLTSDDIADALRYAIDVILERNMPIEDCDRASDLRYDTMFGNYSRCSFEETTKTVLADLAKLIDASS